MILKAVLINNCELFTNEYTHYEAMLAWLHSHDEAERPVREKQLDDGVVDLRFGYVDSARLDQFMDHQFESVERRGERWQGIFRPQPPLHSDPSEFTSEPIASEHVNDACNYELYGVRSKENNK